MLGRTSLPVSVSPRFCACKAIVGAQLNFMRYEKDFLFYGNDLPNVRVLKYPSRTSCHGVKRGHYGFSKRPCKSG